MSSRKSPLPHAVLDAPAWVWWTAAAPRLLLCLCAAVDPALALRGDSFGYIELARSLLRGDFSLPFDGGFVPDTFRTPGYPLFLAPLAMVFPSPVLPAALLQSLLGVLTAVMGWRWLQRLSGKEGAALGTLWLALDPILVLHTPLILTEALFTFLLTAALAVTWSQLGRASPGGAAASGLLWSLSAMVRPIAFYLPPLLCWFWRRRPAALALFLAAAYALPGAWMLRNRRVAGRLFFSSLSARDVLRYPAAGIEAMRTGRTMAQLDEELRAEVERTRPEGFSSETERSFAYQRRGMEIVRAHPVLLLRYLFWGAMKTLGATGLELVVEWVPGHRQERALWNSSVAATGRGTLALMRAYPLLIPLHLAYMLALAAVYAANVLGWARLWRARRHAEASLLSVCLAYLLALSSTEGQARYRAPMVPLLAAGLAAAVPQRRLGDAHLS